MFSTAPLEVVLWVLWTSPVGAIFQPFAHLESTGFSGRKFLDFV